jgi:hypothetical protein
MMIIPEIERETGEDLRMRPFIRETSFGEYMKAKFQQGFDWTTLGLVSDQFSVSAEESGALVDPLTGAPMQGLPPPPSAVKLSKEEWKESPHWRKGIEWFEGMTDVRARIYAENYDNRRYRDSLIERSPTGFRSVLGFGASLAGQALDPVNYIPVLGPAGKAGGFLAKGVGAIRAKAGASALEAMIGTAATEPLVMQALKAQGEDVKWTAAAIDILFSAPIGGLFGAGSGLVRKMQVDSARRRLSRIDRMLLGDTMEKALADVEAGNPVNVKDALSRISTERLENAASEHGFEITFDRKLSPEEKASALKDRQSIREYLDGLEPQQVKALKLDSPEEYRAVLVGMVEKLFPEGADIRFRTEAGVFDYDHLLTDAVRRNYLHTLPETLKRAHVKVEISGDGVRNAYLIKKYFDDDIQKDIWDILVLKNNELRSKIAREGRKGGGYVERLILKGAGSEASRSATPAGPLEIASSQARSMLESIIPDGGKVKPDLSVTEREVLDPALDATLKKAEQSINEGSKSVQEELSSAVEALGFDPKTGSFPERAEIDILRKEGRLLPAEEAMLAMADEVLEKALRYERALKVAANCLVRN